MINHPIVYLILLDMIAHVNTEMNDNIVRKSITQRTIEQKFVSVSEFWSLEPRYEQAENGSFFLLRKFADNQTVLGRVFVTRR